MSDNNSGIDIMEQDLYDGKPEKDQQSGKVRKDLPPRDQYGAALSRNPAVRLHTTQAQQIQKTAPVYPSSSSSTHNYFVSVNRCKKCKVDVLDGQAGIECDGCKIWHHLECTTGVTIDEYYEAVKNTGHVAWKCDACIENIDAEQVQVEQPIGEILEENKTLSSTCGKRKLCTTDNLNSTVKRQRKHRYAVVNCSVDGRRKLSHPVEPMKIVMKFHKIKAKAKDAGFGQSTKTNLDILQQIDIAASEPSTSKGMINRLTGTLTPDDPKDLDFKLNLDYLKQKAPEFFKKEVVVGNNRHLIFYTDKQLKLLAKAKTLYMDNSFRIINTPGMQMFSIHAFVQSDASIKQVPLVFCFMSGKNKDDYYKVLRAIDLCPPKHIKLQSLVIDFEAGLWQAVHQIFPGIPIQGCAFRWVQTVLQKIQENGLQSAYIKKDTIYGYFRQLMELPFLPSKHIPGAFQWLDARAENPGVQKIMDHIYNTWIYNSVFEIDFWSVFITSIRNNKDVDVWHSRVSTSGPVPFYSLVSEMFALVSDLPLKLKMVSKSKLSQYQRKENKQNGQIFDRWDKYCKSTILKDFACVYGQTLK